VWTVQCGDIFFFFDPEKNLRMDRSTEKGGWRIVIVDAHCGLSSTVSCVVAKENMDQCVRNNRIVCTDETI
jgi:hypothetical protein